VAHSEASGEVLRDQVLTGPQPTLEHLGQE
jgi:hypothetical protein